MTNPLWLPDIHFIAQASHMLGGAWIVLAGSRFLKWSPERGLVIALLFAAVKEWIFDLVVELDSVPSSTVDVVFYALGSVLQGIALRLWRR